VSARSIVQDSGAPARLPCGGARFPKLAAVFLSCSRIALYSIARCRSRRCSLGCRRLRRSCQNGRALFRHLLLHTARRCGWCSLRSRPLLGDRRREHRESAAVVVARRGRTPPLTPYALLAPLAEAGACEPLPSSLASQTKNVSARSIVQDSGAPAWLRAAARDSRRSQLQLFAR
jgi:hypothetical protein